MDALRNDVSRALRNLARTPGFAAVVVGIIAIAVAANTLVFSLVDAAFLDPLPVERPDRLVRLFGIAESEAAAPQPGAYLPTSFPNYEDFRDRARSFSGVELYTVFPVGIAEEGRAQQVTAQMVTHGFFDTLGVEAALGRTFLPSETADEPGAHPVAVLSHHLWSERFGRDQDVIGQSLPLNGRDITIVGVAPAGFRGLDFQFEADLWVPLAMFRDLAPSGWVPFLQHRRGQLFQCVARLTPGVSRAAADEEVRTLARRLAEEYPEWNDGRSAVLLPVSEARIDPNRRHLFTRSGSILMSIVGIILLIACANVANLLLVRAAGRRRETAVRLALGVGRGRLVSQLLSESLILALAGGALGIALAGAAAGSFWKLRPPFLLDWPLEITLDGRVLAFAGAVTLLTGVLFGMAPVLASRRLDLVDSLKGTSTSATGGRRRWTARKLLVAIQVGLSLAALAGAGLFARSLGNALAIDPGFDTKHLALASVNAAAIDDDATSVVHLYRRVADAVGSLPGVRSVSLAASPPLSFDLLRRVYAPGAASPDIETEGVYVAIRAVDSRYFDTLGIEVEDGRAFDGTDRADTRPVAIVNQTLDESFWPNESAVGRSLRFSGDDRPVEIVGVVSDAKYVTLGEQARPFIYVALEQSPPPSATVHVATSGPPDAILAPLLRRLHEVEPAMPVPEVETVSDLLAQALWAPRVGALLLGLFAGIALLLAALGVYGVLAHTVVGWSREIGVRLALGASRRQVVGLVLRRALGMVAVGAIGGLVLAFLLGRSASALLYGVAPWDPPTLVSAVVALFVVTIVAALLPARKAARIDPVVTMRS